MYSVKELEKMLKKGKEYLQDLMLDVKVCNYEIGHLERCIEIAKERGDPYGETR